MTDPISDTITRIRNAYLARKNECVIPHSNVREALCGVLASENFVNSVSVDGEIPHKTINVSLRYVNGTPAISSITRASKPGRRQYLASKKLVTPLSGYGVSIVSTSKGMMTDKAARQANLGGELICRIY